METTFVWESIYEYEEPWRAACSRAGNWNVSGHGNKNIQKQRNGLNGSKTKAHLFKSKSLSRGRYNVKALAKATE